MMSTASQVFKDLEQKKRKPIYLVVGEEPFQANEILNRLKTFLVKDALFQYERFDATDIDIEKFKTSLETLPSLFAEEESTRFVVCDHFDKLSASNLEQLDAYFNNPSETTCLLLFAAKADRRKGWVKKVEAKGVTIEIREPFDRDWPKWLSYFEQKFSKSIEPAVWQRIVLTCQNSLSLVNSELEKLSLFVGERKSITSNDALALTLVDSESDPFGFTEDVFSFRRFDALKRYHALKRGGESDIKLGSLLARQVRLIRECRELLGRGIRDPKIIGGQVGLHPFFVPKLIEQTSLYNERLIHFALGRLAECDYQFKTSGNVSLLEGFLIPFWGFTAQLS